ncbi:DUF6861 domain-containing protein [Pseudoduganella sp. R-32]|uniref:DUF6861 domain-containing protein n=1 Tax=Pseudoduganella sp. R-32 TaxID=3404061 RepID=UPI003CEA67E4
MLNQSSRIWSELEKRERQVSKGHGTGSVFDSMGRAISPAPPFGIGNFASQSSRVERVQRALEQSGDMARRIIVQQLSGIDLSSIWHILIEVCKDMALYYGGSVVAGATVGAVGGAFFGGVGALPGAAAGAAVGSQVGAWVMALLGLKSLIEGMVTAIPEAMEHYERGFREAWGPPPRNERTCSYALAGTEQGNVRHAAFEFANGHVIMIMAILMALLAYFSRGKGNKALALKEVRESPRLGPKVARWIEENEEKLSRHPALQSRRKNAASALEEPAPAPPKRKRPTEEPEPRRPVGMPQKKVPCFKPNDLPQGSLPEFDRQLAGQEAGLNAMTVEEYMEGRKAFTAKDAIRDPKVAKQAREGYERRIVEALTIQFRKIGLSVGDAETKAMQEAATRMKALAALHNPDMVVAGRDVISDFGDRNINSRIGSQWRSRVGTLDDAAKEVPISQRTVAKMNVKLERCK